MLFPRTITFGLLTAIGSFCLVGATHGQSSNINDLQKYDNSFLQGTYKYKYTSKNASIDSEVQSISLSMEKDFRSAGMRDEEIRKRLDNFRKGAEREKSFNDSSATLRYIFDSKKRFIHESTITLAPDKKRIIKQIYDGEDELVLTQEAPQIGFQIDLHSGKPTETGSSQRFGGLYTGANIIFGRGLSFLKDIEIRKEGSDLVLHGNAPGRTTVRAVLDEKNRYLAKRIDRYTKDGILLSHIELGKPYKIKEGISIASTADFLLYRDGKEFVHDTYTLEKADVLPPPAEEFSIVFKQGDTIIDSRMEKPIVFHKTKPEPVSKKQLLELTRLHIIQEAKLAEENRVSEAKKRRKDMLSLISLAAITVSAVAIIAAVALVARRLARTRK